MCKDFPEYLNDNCAILSLRMKVLSHLDLYFQHPVHSYEQQRFRRATPNLNYICNFLCQSEKHLYKPVHT